MGLGLIPAILDDRVRRAVGAHHAVGPAHGPNRLVAFGVVDKVLDVYHGSTARAWETVRVEGTGDSTKRTDYNDSEADPNHHPAIHLEPSLFPVLIERLFCPNAVLQNGLQPCDCAG